MRNMFLCWSGQRSRSLARALHEFLPRFIPGLLDNPADNTLFMSDDIAKGSRWFDNVETQLDNADVGLVCITREGLESGWIHFEAGALARAVRKKRTHGSTLYTYLLGVRSDELKGPLAEFQATSFDRDDTKSSAQPSSARCDRTTHRRERSGRRRSMRTGPRSRRR